MENKLTFGELEGYSVRASAKSGAGNVTPISQGARAPIRERFFCARRFMVGCIGPLRRAAPWRGSDIPLQPATLIQMSLVGGGNLTKCQGDCHHV